MPSYGYGDALSKQVDVLIRTGDSTADVGQLKDVVVQLNAVLASTVSVMREDGAAADAMAAAIKPIIGDIRDLSRGIAEYERNQRAAAEADGDALRARADGYARAERVQEQWAGSVRQAMQAVRQVEGDALRERAEAHARAERASEDGAAAATRAANQIREADEAIARAEHMAMAAGQDHARAMDAAGGRAEWLARQDVELASALQGLAAAERTAEMATVTHTAATGRAGASVDEFGRRMGGASRGVLELSRGVEDFATGGPLGILNNIPGIAFDIGQAMGASALKVNIATAAISLAGTGVYLLWKNWDSLKDSLGQGIPRPALEGVDGLKEKLKETDKVIEDLRKKSRWNLAESMQFAEATAKAKELNAELERQRDLKDLLGSRSKEQRERASGFEEAIGESGGGAAVMDLIREAFSRQADDKGQVKDDVTNKWTDAKTAAENLLLEARKGDLGARNQVSKLARSIPGGEAFSQTITETSPESKALADAAKEGQALLDQMNRHKEKAERDADRTAPYDPNDPFDKAQMENELWLSTGKPKREAREKAQAKGAKDAQRGAADDIRDALRDVAVGGGDAGTKQEAINQVADRIKAQAATLGAELAGDLMRQAHAAYNAAAKQGATAEAKAEHAGRPNAQIQHAAAPLVDLATASGVPHAQAQHDVTKEISRLMAHGLDLQTAQEATIGEMEGYLANYAMRLNALEQRQNQTRNRLQSRRGTGQGSLLPSVR